jgi:rabenosyn-5
MGTRQVARFRLEAEIRGTWCRVCETCYKERDGYYDTDGAFTDHTAKFIATRQKIVDRTYLEANRLEKRLTKLLALMANPPKPEPQQTSFLRSLTGSQSNQRNLEQQVVTWQDDESITTCPFCDLPFNFSNRKHHCRLCGRLVCGNPATGCSSNVGLNVQQGEKGAGEISVDVRMCRDCKGTIFGKRDFAKESNKTPKYVQTYQATSTPVCTPF